MVRFAPHDPSAYLKQLGAASAARPGAQDEFANKLELATGVLQAGREKNRAKLAGDRMGLLGKSFAYGGTPEIGSNLLTDPNIMRMRRYQASILLGNRAEAAKQFGSVGLGPEHLAIQRQGAAAFQPNMPLRQFVPSNIVAAGMPKVTDTSTSLAGATPTVQKRVAGAPTAAAQAANILPKMPGEGNVLAGGPGKLSDDELAAQPDQAQKVATMQEAWSKYPDTSVNRDGIPHNKMEILFVDDSGSEVVVHYVDPNGVRSRVHMTK
jgi:hypothetical protein